MGDSIGDLGMANGNKKSSRLQQSKIGNNVTMKGNDTVLNKNDENIVEELVLSIGFCNRPDSGWEEKFMNAFDIVVLNDVGVEAVQLLLKGIASEPLH